MKILSSRKDDILKRKAEYEQAKATWDEDMNARHRAYQTAEDSATAPIRDAIEQILSKYDLLTFDVSVGGGRLFRSKRGYAVTIRCNNNRVNDETSALSWDYNVWVSDKGHVERESSSWSGMSACTLAQIQSLKQTAACVEALYGLDWAALLDRPRVREMDFYKDMPDMPKRPNFEQELIEAEIEDLIGSDKIIKVRGWESCPYRGEVWLKLLRETPSQYEAIIIPDSMVRIGKEVAFINNHAGYTNRIRKSTVKPVNPLQIKDV